MSDNEYHIVSMCDSNIGTDNKLNDFTAPLPMALEFPEPYSVAVTDITFPNMMYNINTDGNMIGFAFYEKYYGDPAHDVVTRIGGDQCRLLYEVKMPVKSMYYPSIEDFGAQCLSYFKRKMIGYI